MTSLTGFNSEADLLQTLLKLAVPGLAWYIGHAARLDATYGVVVRTLNGLRTIKVPTPVLALINEGILVEHDRLSIRKQLDL
ncbi:MAG: hypothetical protein EOO61_05040 [Hymenobacter sp.]|nr:MAG: hypothetical protein EOO61_05040 [Hymenobacter sp.]